MNNTTSIGSLRGWCIRNMARRIKSRESGERAREREDNTHEELISRAHATRATSIGYEMDLKYEFRSMILYQSWYC